MYLLIKSVAMNARYIPRVNASFTIPVLTSIAFACDKLLYGTVYKAVFLLAYFAFLRFLIWPLYLPMILMLHVICCIQMLFLATLGLTL